MHTTQSETCGIRHPGKRSAGTFGQTCSISCKRSSAGSPLDSGAEATKKEPECRLDLICSEFNSVYSRKSEFVLSALY